MQKEKRKVRVNNEQQWANPANPGASTDERDEEQLIRQHKEAERLKNNLTTDKETK